MISPMLHSEVATQRDTAQAELRACRQELEETKRLLAAEKAARVADAKETTEFLRRASERVNAATAQLEAAADTLEEARPKADVPSSATASRTTLSAEEQDVPDFLRRAGSRLFDAAQKSEDRDLRADLRYAAERTHECASSLVTAETIQRGLADLWRIVMDPSGQIDEIKLAEGVKRWNVWRETNYQRHTKGDWEG